MYAIVDIQGQQFKAEEGKKLFVHHIKDVEAGKTVEFDKVLLVDANGAVNPPHNRNQGLGEIPIPDSFFHTGV